MKRCWIVGYLIVGFAVLLGLLHATSYLYPEYRVLCDKFVGDSPLPTVVGLGAIGCTMGMAVGCLLAPRAYFETAGRSWLSVWGASTVAAMRLRCAVVAAVTGLATSTLWYLALFVK